jgi:hypothetical protein
LSERQCGGDHVCALLSHASAVIDDQPDSNRNIFMTEVFDLLKDVILINLKAVFFEARDERIVPVHNGRA